MRMDATSSSRARSSVASRLTRRSWLTWLLAQIVAAAPVSVAFLAADGVKGPSLWYVVALAGIIVAQQLSIVTLRRRIGPEPASPADLLTLARASIGAALVALVVAHFADRLSLVGWLVCLSALIGATVLDWLDGPLARRLGPTRLGAVLDIEADSWLTLACALAAVAWGGLPWWVLVPPIVRYVYPSLALLRGGLPSGGGPWWSRVTGVAQMTLLLGALVPVEFSSRATLLTLLAIPVSAAQLTTMLALLFLRRDARP